MPTIVISPEIFEREAKRRLIDTHTLGQELGLRSRQALWTRVEKGQLPDPVFRGKNLVTLWDRDAIPELNPDRKEA